RAHERGLRHPCVRRKTCLVRARRSRSARGRFHARPPSRRGNTPLREVAQSCGRRRARISATGASTMKAIVLTAYGDADRLELRELPDPTPDPREIAVRVAGTSINPVDWKLRSGALARSVPLELPAVLGRDAAGTVIAVGAE